MFAIINLWSLPLLTVDLRRSSCSLEINLKPSSPLPSSPKSIMVIIVNVFIRLISKLRIFAKILINFLKLKALVFLPVVSIFLLFRTVRIALNNCERKFFNMCKIKNGPTFFLLTFLLLLSSCFHLLPFWHRIRAKHFSLKTLFIFLNWTLF